MFSANYFPFKEGRQSRMIFGEAYEKSMLIGIPMHVPGVQEMTDLGFEGSRRDKTRPYQRA